MEIVYRLRYDPESDHPGYHRMTLTRELADGAGRRVRPISEREWFDLTGILDPGDMRYPAGLMERMESGTVARVLDLPAEEE